MLLLLKVCAVAPLCFKISHPSAFCVKVSFSNLKLQAMKINNYQLGQTYIILAVT